MSDTEGTSMASWSTVEVSIPVLVLQPNGFMTYGGDGTSPGVLVDFGGDSALVFLGANYGPVEVGVETVTAPPNDDGLDEWETVEEGSITVGGAIVVMPHAAGMPPLFTPIPIDGTGPGIVGIRVHVRGREATRADVAVLITAWMADAPVPFRALKIDDTFLPARMLDTPTQPPPAPRSEARALGWSAVAESLQSLGIKDVFESGASAAAVAAAEMETGSNWPEELTGFFTAVDGFRDGQWMQLFPEHDLLSLHESLRSRREQLQIWDELLAEDPEMAEAYQLGSDSYAAGSVAGRFISEYVPIAERDGYLLVVDTRPGPSTGCVIEYMRDDADSAGPRWPSVGAVLADLVAGLQGRTLFADVWRASVVDGSLTWALVSSV